MYPALIDLSALLTIPTDDSVRFYTPFLDDQINDLLG
jgi:hypothetical protein